MILSDRDEFLGVHVTPAVKDALRMEASRRRLSMSAFVYNTLLAALKHAGVQIDEEPEVRAWPPQTGAQSDEEPKPNDGNSHSATA